MASKLPLNMQMVYFRDGMTIDPEGDIGPKFFQHFCSTRIHGLSSKKSIEITPMGLTFFKDTSQWSENESTTPTPNP